jgi:hypothetical protein
MTKRALVVGTNYPGTNFSLAGCVNDGLDWSHMLAARGFVVDTLFDQQASRDAIVDNLQELLSISEFGDILVFTFSGHGTYVPGGQDEPRDEAICPNDIREAGVITDDQLFGLFSERRRGVRAVMVADSCYSGTLNRLAPALAPEATRLVRFLPPAAWMGDQQVLDHPRWTRAAASVGRVTLRSGALVLAGCGEQQVCYDAWFDGRANGAFSYAALKALVELGDDPDYRAWMRQIRRYLPSVDFDQRPQLDGLAYQKDWPVLDDGEEG